MTTLSTQSASVLDPDETQEIALQDEFFEKGRNGHHLSPEPLPDISEYSNGHAPGALVTYSNAIEAPPRMKMLKHKTDSAVSTSMVHTSMAVVPFRRSRLEMSLQIARVRLNDFDGSLILSGSSSLSLRNLTQFIDELRLRMMAGKGSRLDQIFKRGEKFVEGWFKFLPILALWESSAQDCSDILMTFCKILLQGTIKGSQLAFDKILTTLQYIGTVLLNEVAPTKREIITTTQVSKFVTDMVVLMVDLVGNLMQFLKISGTDHESLSRLAIQLSTFTSKWTSLQGDFKLEIWRQEVSRGGHLHEDISIEVLRNWLASNEAGTRPGVQGPSVPLFDGLPLDWLRSMTTKFRNSEDYMLVVTGEAGVGKSGLMGSILDQLKLSESHSITTLTFSIGKYYKRSSFYLSQSQRNRSEIICL
jgi:hypothetical protein